MGLFSRKRNSHGYFTDQKWDFINLSDFKAKGCGPGFFYGWLWLCLVLSVAVYAVDSFTAVNLLVFNRWSSKIKPAIPLAVSRWVFSSCIIASFINLAYEGIRAARVMRRRNVAACYLDSLAVRWESVRLGSGQGWRRFLVFTELTKSKKGAEYIALFTYFNFQSWIRVLLCSGPRQVVNAFTVRSVYVSKLAPDAHARHGPVAGFFVKIGALAKEDYQQAVMLSGMCFTLVIWIFSALFLLAAVLFYVFFLFHYLPQADGGLTGYCQRKVNKRLTRIVTNKINKALARSEAEQAMADAASIRNGCKPPLQRAATLPTLPTAAHPHWHHSLSKEPFYGHNGSWTTLPSYTSRPGTPDSLQRALGYSRPAFSRSGSAESIASYSSRVPLTTAMAGTPYCRNATVVFAERSALTASPDALDITDTSIFTRPARTLTRHCHDKHPSRRNGTDLPPSASYRPYRADDARGPSSSLRLHQEPRDTSDYKENINQSQHRLIRSSTAPARAYAPPSRYQRLWTAPTSH